MSFTYFTLAISIIVPLIGLGYLLLRIRRQKSDQPDFFSTRLQPTIARIMQRARDWNIPITSLKTIFGSVEQPIKMEEMTPDSEPTAPPSQKITLESAKIIPAQTVVENAAEQNNHNDSPSAEKIVRINLTAEIPVGSIIHITMTTGAEDEPVSKQEIITPAPKQPAFYSHILSKIRFTNAQGMPAIAPKANLGKLNTTLFGLAIIVYIITRFIGLSDFPIYFFSDEAVQTVTAADLVNHAWQGPNGNILPTYFQNGPYYNLSASVYAQVVPYLIFGKSVWVTRGTSVLITILAALAMGLILRDALNISRWWLGPLILAISPAWFLHSRTAFETAIFVSLYATLIYFYLLYRLRNPKYLYATVIVAGLAFYSYSPGQLVVAITTILLFLFDIRYHLQNRSVLIRAALVLALIALPYLRFRLTVPYSPLDHLHQLASYWVQPLPLSKKILTYAQNYFYGISPQYWFIPNDTDLIRHQMKNYGHLMLWTLPLFVLGVFVALRRIGQSSYRTILIALLAAPAGGALANIGITRVLVFVIPASLLIAIGLTSALDWIKDRVSNSYSRYAQLPIQTTISLLLFFIMAGMSINMMRDAIANGPTWFQDYTLYGMQYGARQIFEQTVLPILRKNSQAQFMVSPSWANGTEQFTSFFIPSEYQSRVRLGQIYDLINEKPVLGSNYYFIVTSDELEKIQSDPKFKNISIQTVINLPTGKPGFYMLNIAFADDIKALLAQQQAEQHKPVEESFDWNGQKVRVVHSLLSGGQLSDLTDGNPDTLAKTLDLNPFNLEFYLTNPIPTSRLDIQTGSLADFTVTVRLYAPGSNEPVEYSQIFKDQPPDPLVTLLFSKGPAQADHIFVSVKDNTGAPDEIIHIREITFK